MELKIDSDFQSCLPELTKEEYTELEKSVISNGILSPILIWNGYIVDGHNRYSILKAHRIENFPVREMTFKDKDHVILWILQNQLGRRNLNDNQRMAAAYKYKDAIAKVKEINRMANLVPGAVHKHCSSIPSKEGIDKEEKKRNHSSDTLTRVADIANVSRASMERFDYIQRHGNEEQKERAEKGGQGNSVTAIVQEIKEQKTETKKCKKCGRVLTLDRFEIEPWNGKIYTRNVCKDCRKIYSETGKDSFGNSVREKHLFDNIDPAEFLRTNNSNKMTSENVASTIRINSQNLVRTLKGILVDNAEVIRNGDRNVIDTVIDDITAEIISLKGVY